MNTRQNLERLGMAGLLAAGLLWMLSERNRVLDELEGVRSELRTMQDENTALRDAFHRYASDMAREMARVAMSGSAD